MKIDGRLKINGRILVIPLNGKGNCTIDASKFTKPNLKKGKKYLNFVFTYCRKHEHKRPYKSWFI